MTSFSFDHDVDVTGGSGFVQKKGDFRRPHVSALEILLRIFDTVTQDARSVGRKQAFDSPSDTLPEQVRVAQSGLTKTVSPHFL